MAATFLFFGLVLIYGISTPTSVTGIGDSDELIANGYLGSLPHPPGYPWLTSLLFITTHLPIPVTVALKANLLSALLSAGAMTLLFLISHKLLSRQNFKNESMVMTSALGAVLLIGLGPLYWYYAATTEFHQLQILILCGIIYLLIRKGTKNFWTIFLLLGLLASHHQTWILFLPGIAWLLIHTIKEFHLKKSGLYIMSFIAPMILGLGLLFVLHSQNQNYSWEMEATVEGVINFLGRRDFAGWSNDTGELMAGYWSGWQISAWKDNLWRFVTGITPEYLGLIPWGLTLFGIITALSKEYRKDFFPVILLLTLGYFGIGAYLEYPLDPTGQGLTERMYLTGLSFLVPVMALGLMIIYQQWIKSEKIFFSGFVLLVVWTVGNNWQIANHRTHNAVGLWAENVASTPGTYFCFSDISCFPLLFMQHVEKKNIEVIPYTAQLNWRLIEKDPILLAHTYEENPFRVLEMVSNRLKQKGEIYLVDPLPIYIAMMGLDERQIGITENVGTLQISCFPGVKKSETEFAISRKMAFDRAFVEMVGGVKKLPKSKICVPITELIQEAEACGDNLECATRKWWQVLLRDNSLTQARLGLATAYATNGFEPLAYREYVHILQDEPTNEAAKIWIEEHPTASELY